MIQTRRSEHQVITNRKAEKGEVLKSPRRVAMTFPESDRRTEQAHKDMCDINQIIKKYDKTGILTHINRMDGDFGEVSGMDFREALHVVMDAQEGFKKLPGDIRKRFGTPDAVLDFVQNPANRKEAIELGMLPAERPPQGQPSTSSGETNSPEPEPQPEPPAE